jgi:hypothetical protein
MSDPIISRLHAICKLVDHKKTSVQNHLVGWLRESAASEW